MFVFIIDCFRDKPTFCFVFDNTPESFRFIRSGIRKVINVVEIFRFYKRF